jgi:hypothetical protein
MRPLLEILEDERMLMLKQDTIYQNMIRYPGMEASNILNTRKRIVDGQLNQIRTEIREYIVELFKEEN